jgi:hypothetical protein
LRQIALIVGLAVAIVGIGLVATVLLAGWRRDEAVRIGTPRGGLAFLSPQPNEECPANLRRE